jgi:hypothetical protein
MRDAGDVVGAHEAGADDTDTEVLAHVLMLL